MYTPDQIDKVLLLASPMDQAYLTLVWLTGARVREINRLTWADVVWENREPVAVVLYTRKSRTKTRTARTVPLLKRAASALKYAWRHRVENSPYVFTNPTMVARYPDNPEKWAYDYRDKFLHTLCRRAGVPEINYHELRHSLASYAASQGIPLTTIQAILGHSKATTTDVYLKSLGHQVVVDVAKLDKAIEGPAPETAPGNVVNLWKP